MVNEQAEMIPRLTKIKLFFFGMGTCLGVFTVEEIKTIIKCIIYEKKGNSNECK